MRAVLLCAAAAAVTARRYNTSAGPLPGRVNVHLFAQYVLRLYFTAFTLYTTPPAHPRPPSLYSLSAHSS